MLRYHVSCMPSAGFFRGRFSVVSTTSTSGSDLRQGLPRAAAHRPLEPRRICQRSLPTLFGRVLSRFLAKPTDNCNVTVNVLGRSLVALTETTLPGDFDPETLETLGHYEYGKQVGGQFSISRIRTTTRRAAASSAMSWNSGRRSRYRLFRAADIPAPSRMALARAPFADLNGCAGLLLFHHP